MKVADVIKEASTDKQLLSLDQKREIRARIRFAEIPEDSELSDAEVGIVKELVAAVASPMPKERTASFGGGGKCPRCGSPVASCRLADQSEASYCNSCHVVVA